LHIDNHNDNDDGDEDVDVVVAGVCVESPFLVNVSGSEVNGSGSQVKVHQLNVHELSHIGRECQLTLKLPGLTLKLPGLKLPGLTHVQWRGDIGQRTTTIHKLEGTRTRRRDQRHCRRRYGRKLTSEWRR